MAEVGAAVWLRDETEGWLPGVVSEKRVISAGGKTCELTIQVDGVNLSERKVTTLDEVETDDVKPRNQDAENAPPVRDLISLPVLHEPAILHALERRYEIGAIYTFNGAILIAVNPFQRLQLYTEEILEAYYNNGLMKSQGIDAGELDPHVYTIADAAYRDMADCLARNVQASQSILISGESGAGKTESTKVCMRYLTVVGAASSGGDGSITADESANASIMDRVLQSNPILEAFGNARTVRNDNSSRFGKFIDLKFDARGAMRGATIDTYLLEKIRLPRHAEGERNFHIFYQLHAATTRDKLDDGIGLAKADLMRSDEPWALHDECATYYQYTKQGGILELAHLDDGVEFVKLAKAFKTLGFEGDDSVRALALVASLLHLGDLVFDFDAGNDGGGSKLSASATFELAHAARLACLPEPALLQALTTRVVKTRGEEYIVRLVPDDAVSARDAVAKALYGRLFDWLVERINAGVATADPSAGLRRTKKKVEAASIGVLDIFGFECFAVNSFEQLCINYTNETLQQQFNRYVFKLEQEEYAREDITWSFIEFPDNQDCLDLIEGGRKQMPPDGGLLTMLDDECRLPRGSDANYAARVIKSLGSRSSRLSVSKKQLVDGIFSLKHYAGNVPYTVKGFMEKNKDELPRAAEDLFLEARRSPKGVLIGAICDSHYRAADRAATSISASKSASGRSASIKPTAGTITVGTQFKAQLGLLMRAIGHTKPHYIRCLKPNDKNVPNQFWRARVTEQLRYGGVLEAVRVARSGFPVRLPHAEFVTHYAVLGPAIKSTSNTERKKAHCEAIIATVSVACGFDAKEAQLGKTKVFLRKSAHDAMEAARALARRAAATVLTSAARSFLCSSSLSKRLAAARLLARVGRGWNGRSRARKQREYVSALAIQRVSRTHRAWSAYVKARRGVTLLQAVVRGAKGRDTADELRRLRAVVLIARTLGRGAPQRRAWVRRRSALISFQSKLRCRMARRALQRLRAAEREVGRLRQEKEAMKEEILRLRQQAASAALEREAAAARASSEEVARLKEAMEREKQQWLDEQKIARQKAADELQSLREASELEIARLKTALEEESAERSRAVEALVLAESERDVARREARELQLRVEEQQRKENAPPQPKAMVRSLSQQQPEASDNIIAKLRAELESERALRLDAEHTASQLRATATEVTRSAPPPPRPQALRKASTETLQSGDVPAADDFQETGDEDVQHFRDKFRSGVQVAVWEENVAACEQVLLVLSDDVKQTLSFQNRSRNLFRRRKPPAPVALSDLCAVRPGHSSLCGLGAAHERETDFITILCDKPADEGTDALYPTSRQASIRREIVVQFASAETRKEALAGMRQLISESDRRGPAREIGDHVDSSKSTMTPQPSKKQPLLHTSPPPPLPQLGSPPKVAATLATPVVAIDDAVVELEKQLLLERANNQKMMLQMLEMQNEVNRSSAKIVELKQEAANLRSQLVARDRMHADDARMRLQLGKRLQQLVFDNAALRRDCDELNAQLAKEY